ncbi:MAG: hypothetical protein Q8P67_07735 [archaeon]|nr:hypothetical protein [archaeon]
MGNHTTCSIVLGQIAFDDTSKEFVVMDATATRIVIGAHPPFF